MKKKCVSSYGPINEIEASGVIRLMKGNSCASVFRSRRPKKRDWSRTFCLGVALNPKDYLPFTVLLKQRWTSVGRDQNSFCVKIYFIKFCASIFFFLLKNRLKL